MPNAELQIDSLSRVGGREYNQDNLDYILYPHTGGCFALADGLGGQGGGEKASKIAITKVMAEKSKVSRRSDIEKLSLVFEHAHQAVQKAQQAFTETARMASTLVILEILDDYAIWGHVGDSRLYLIRQGKIQHQTKDHSVPQMLVGSGELDSEEIRGHPDRNRLLRALGDKRETIKARMVKTPEKLQNGDAFLLCSDGFWEWVKEDEMLETLASSSSAKEWLQQLQHLVIQRANKDCDNYSALVLWYQDDATVRMPSLESPVVGATAKKQSKVNSWKHWRVFRWFFLKE